MSWWDEDLARLKKLVKNTFAEFEAIWSPQGKPGTATRDNQPAGEEPRWTRDNKPRPGQGQPQPRTRKAAAGPMVDRAMLLHRPGDDTDVAATLKRLENQLAETAALDAARLTAAGLVAAYRGRPEEARSLLELVDGFDRYNDPGAARIALQWLAADAASRGDWVRARALGLAKSDKDPTGQVAFFAALATWHLRLDDELKSPLELQQMADAMPDVANALELVTAATSPGGPVPAELEHDEGLLGQAVAMHAKLRATPASQLQTSEVRQLGRLWDRVLQSRHVARGIGERAAALGARTKSNQVLERLSETVQADLGKKLLDSHVDLSEVADGDRDGVLGGLIDRLEERLSTELDMSMAALGERLDAERSLPLLGECQQWLSLRRQVDRLGRLCGASGRLVAFNSVYPSVGSWSIDLWNKRKAHSLANAMFHWIADSANAIEEYRVAETYTKNQEW